MVKRTAPATERFASLFERRGLDECWPWTGFVGTNGYGVMYDKRKPIPAHRFAWELANRCRIPTGLLIRHTCDNPVCVNPAHLLLGTHKDNVRDMISRGRQANQRKTHCPSGHAYTPVNTHTDKKGIRHCRACWRERARAYSKRRAA